MAVSGDRTLSGFSLLFSIGRDKMKESNTMGERDRVATKDGKEKTKNDRKTRTCAEKEPGTGADARRAGHPVCGPAAHRAGLCGRQLGLEGPARGIVRPVRLRQLRAGRSDLLSGHPLHTGRRPHRPDVQADTGACVCQRHRHRLFRDPRRHPGGPHGSGVLSERRPCLAGRRCHRCPAGRQSAAALRASGGKSRDGGAGALCQPVHF